MTNKVKRCSALVGGRQCKHIVKGSQSLCKQHIKMKERIHFENMQYNRAGMVFAHLKDIYENQRTK